ncbi:MAG: hypothetical protein ACI9NY_000747 [Kiritimatiellia bacterium]|jgi:hypothetical protein
MSALHSLASDIAEGSQRRVASNSENAAVMTDIYREDTNMVVWRRGLPACLQSSMGDFLQSNNQFKEMMTVTPKRAQSSIIESLGHTECAVELSENIAELVDMFCCLFGLQQAGLRLTVLSAAMCPRFHVDRVPCRLITTYHGSGTEWLPHQCVDRTKLGAGNLGLADDQSGLFQCTENIQQLTRGDVALFKGESWEGNEHAGVVHRSPRYIPGETRLLLTLDFVA